MPLVRDKIKQLGLSKKALNIIMKSWRIKTRRQYDTYLVKFTAFCKKRKMDPLVPNTNTAIEFLTDLFEKGCGYSALNTARSALSTLNGIGSDPLVCRFIKGVFNLRPIRSRYNYVWDVSTVLNYLRSLSPARDLNLFMLGAKLLMLCALVTGQRCQTLHAMTMDKDNMCISGNKAVFRIVNLLKHNSPSNPQTDVTLHSFAEDKRLCVLTYLRIYLKRTRALRSSNKLFISTHRPHAGVTKDTLSRWIKLVLSKSGIDTTIFKAHSTRAASSSSAAKNIDVWHVLKTAEWKRESTFARFYKKPIISVSSSESFAHSILSSKPAQL